MSWSSLNERTECENITSYLEIRSLVHRVSHRFQWVFCQLELLRHAVQPDVQAILDDLPETLDGTYERVLKNINAKNRAHASRLLHCLAVAVRPLRVEELAEILTFDFAVAQGGIPKFRPNRRLKDQEDAVLSICSSLVTIVDKGGSRVVQFSHLSVKEFLTSDHLATSTGNLSTYQILPEPAHTILAQACLGLLLHLDDRIDNESIKESPLAEYAARHWIAHAQFEGVASRVEDGVKSLYDLGKPHVATWMGLYNHYSGTMKANNIDEITCSSCAIPSLALRMLKDSRREQDRAERSKMVLSTRSVHKPQHCVRCLR